MTDGIAGNFDYYATSKEEWTATYLQTGSWQVAQQTALRPVFDFPDRTHLAEKLEFMREHRLSFFNTSPNSADYLPWGITFRVIWNNGFPAFNMPYKLGRDAELTLIARRAGTATVTMQAPRLEGDPVSLEFTREQETTQTILDGTANRLTFPVHAGVNRITVRRVGESIEDVSLLPPVMVGPVTWHEMDGGRASADAP